MAKGAFDTGFGSLARDRQGGVLQTPTQFVTQDATGTPQTSPLAYTSSVVTIVVPDAAVQLVLSPTTDLRVSESAAISRYDIVPGGAKEAFPVTLMQNVYIRQDSVAGTVRFRFVSV